MSKYTIVEDDYDHVDQSFHNTYDTTKEFEDDIKLFASRLPKHATVLNVGGTAVECEYFMRQGFVVENLDISQAMLDYISEHSPKTKVTKGNIKDFKSTPYDGIWACRSLIHIPPKDLHLTVKNIFMLLKHGGYFGSVLFTSDLSHPEEQELPEEHATEKGVTYYRVLYPKQIILGVYRRAGLTPVLVKAVEDTDGDKALSILAQQTLPKKYSNRTGLFEHFLNMTWVRRSDCESDTVRF